MTADRVIPPRLLAAVKQLKAAAECFRDPSLTDDGIGLQIHWISRDEENVSLAIQLITLQSDVLFNAFVTNLETGTISRVIGAPPTFSDGNEHGIEFADDIRRGDGLDLNIGRPGDIDRAIRLALNNPNSKNRIRRHRRPVATLIRIGTSA